MKWARSDADIGHKKSMENERFASSNELFFLLTQLSGRSTSVQSSAAVSCATITAMSQLDRLLSINAIHTLIDLGRVHCLAPIITDHIVNDVNTFRGIPLRGSLDSLCMRSPLFASSMRVQRRTSRIESDVQI